MSPHAHYTGYDDETTTRCERALVTLLGDLGPWGRRLFLAGGLAPRYLVGALPDERPAHVGTTGVDLVVGLALGDASPETYRTLENNLRTSFVQDEPSFRWRRSVGGANVLVELLCETDQVEYGRIFRPKGERAGARLGAFNVRGAHLVRDDFVEHEIAGERLDGGQSRVTLRVAGLLPYVVLKTFAFQERHENKDAYDLVFTLANYAGGPREGGVAAARSVVADRPDVRDALLLLGERFDDVTQDGPHAYAAFLATPGDAEQHARLRQEAVAVIRRFRAGFLATPRPASRGA